MFFRAIHSVPCTIPPEYPPCCDGTVCIWPTRTMNQAHSCVPFLCVDKKRSVVWINVSGGNSGLIPPLPYSWWPEYQCSSGVWCSWNPSDVLCLWRGLHCAFCHVSQCRGCFSLHSDGFGRLETFPLRKFHCAFSVNIFCCPWDCGFLIAGFGDFKTVVKQ